MMLYRGIEVTYESIREWCQKFGESVTNQDAKSEFSGRIVLEMEQDGEKAQWSTSYASS